MIRIHKQVKNKCLKNPSLSILKHKGGFIMPKMKYMIYAVLVMLLLAGCANTSTNKDAANEQSVQPVRYVKEEGQTTTEDNRDLNNTPPSYDSYSKEESEAFQELISSHVELDDVQVVTSADRVVVAVQMKRGATDKDFEEISNHIKNILQTDKELFIYNNVAKWEQVKDFHAQDEANQMGKETERLFQSIFD